MFPGKPQAVDSTVGITPVRLRASTRGLCQNFVSRETNRRISVAESSQTRQSGVND